MARGRRDCSPVLMWYGIGPLFFGLLVSLKWEEMAGYSNVRQQPGKKKTKKMHRAVDICLLVAQDLLPTLGIHKTESLYPAVFIVHTGQWFVIIFVT